MRKWLVVSIACMFCLSMSAAVVMAEQVDPKKKPPQSSGSQVKPPTTSGQPTKPTTTQGSMPPQTSNPPSSGMQGGQWQQQGTQQQGGQWQSR